MTASTEEKHSVCVIIRHDRDRFVAIRARKRGDQIELPGGKVNPGESLHVAACREVHEETNLRVRALAEIASGPCQGFTAHVFVAEATGEPQGSEEGEVELATGKEIVGGSFSEFLGRTPAALLALGVLNLRLPAYKSDDDAPDCPGEWCPRCTADACARCGPRQRLWERCDHDVVERHTDACSCGHTAADHDMGEGTVVGDDECSKCSCIDYDGPGHEIEAYLDDPSRAPG